MEVKNKQYYMDKLEKIEMLESISYQNLEEKQNNYKEKVAFYQKQKDEIGVKIRMLEVYQNILGDLESQMGIQAFLNEEFWNNISFAIIKYDKFIQELDEIDYNKKTKTAIDKKMDKDLWDQREQFFETMKNDISHMSTNFGKLHSEIHERTLLQRQCIEKHIFVFISKYNKAKARKERYRDAFTEIQKDIGAKGNKMSIQALSRYKISIAEGTMYSNLELAVPGI